MSQVWENENVSLPLIEEKNTKPNHYKSLTIDVITFCMVNNLDFMQGNVIKYVCRYRKKGGIEDLKKARDYIDRLIEFEKKKN